MMIKVLCPELPPPVFDEPFPVPVELVPFVTVPIVVGDALAFVGVADGCVVELGLAVTVGVGVTVAGAAVIVKCFTPVV